MINLVRKWYFLVVSPSEIKGFSGQPVTVAGFFWGDYGYPMGNLNSQTHFKIGDASLNRWTIENLSSKFQLNQFIHFGGILA